MASVSGTFVSEITLFESMKKSATQMSVFAHEIMVMLSLRDPCEIGGDAKITDVPWGWVVRKTQIRVDKISVRGQFQPREIETVVQNCTFNLGRETFSLTCCGDLGKFYDSLYKLVTAPEGAGFTYSISFPTSGTIRNGRADFRAESVSTSILMRRPSDNERSRGLSIEWVENFEAEHGREEGVFEMVATKLRETLKYLQTSSR